jgi:[ribosomal protein S5]-alanine N-acetyltransferase
MRLNFPDAVPGLHTDLVRLREPAEDDIPAWFQRASDAESAWLAGDPIPASIDVGLSWLEGHRQRFREQTGIRWVIVPQGSTRSVGSIGLVITSKDECIAELGFVIDRACWGQGLGTAAAVLVTRFAFATLGLEEIRAELLQSNLASRRVLEKVGFQLERTIPGFDVSDTGTADGYLYVLRHHTPARKEP